METMFDERIMELIYACTDEDRRRRFRNMRKSLNVYYGDRVDDYEISDYPEWLLNGVLVFDYLFGLVIGALCPENISTVSFGRRHISKLSVGNIVAAFDYVRSDGGHFRWTDIVPVYGDLFRYRIDELDVNSLHLSLFVPPKPFDVTTMQWQAYVDLLGLTNMPAVNTWEGVHDIRTEQLLAGHDGYDQASAGRDRWFPPYVLTTVDDMGCDTAECLERSCGIWKHTQAILLNWVTSDSRLYYYEFCGATSLDEIFNIEI